MRDPARELDALRAATLHRTLRPLGSGQGTKVARAGRRLTNFSSNDYLGLAASPVLAEAMAEGARRWGAGAGASRLVCGSLPPHGDLEEALAAAKGTGAAVAFSSGYATAVGVMGALLGRGDTAILDKLCHASLIDGARLSGATVRVFPHNHMGKLGRLLAGVAAGPETRVLVVTESVFSMDGDRAPLAEIVDLARRHGALVLLDEAHAFGVLGPRGAGLAAELGLAGSIDLQMGTLSKAAGTSGGYLCASRTLVDLVVNRARSFIYSTAPPPAVAAAAAAAVRLLASAEGDRLRERLRDNLGRWGQLTGTSPRSPIVPHMVGDEAAALRMAAALEEAGFLVPAIRFPTVARAKARLRITFSAAHTADEIGALHRAVGALLE